MKLLVQSDDYGISKAQALGCVHGIANGIIRNTGMFTNMPWSKECFHYIEPYLDQIAFGIDLNITTGKALTPHSEIPSITKEDGSFYTSWESRQMDERLNCEHVVFDEVFKELNAQVERFIEIVGKKPDYIHPHAYRTELITQVQQSIAKRYDIIYSDDLMKKWSGIGIDDYRIPWYLKPTTLENQQKSSLKEYLLNHGENLIKQEIVFLIGHMGYIDYELMELSTYTLYRMSDLMSVCDAEILKWIKENHIELINYKNIEK